MKAVSLRYVTDKISIEKRIQAQSSFVVQTEVVRRHESSSHSKRQTCECQWSNAVSSAHVKLEYFAIVGTVPRLFHRAAAFLSFDFDLKSSDCHGRCEQTID